MRSSDNNSNITSFNVTTKATEYHLQFLWFPVEGNLAALKGTCKEIFYNFCKDCTRMAALPQGAFAACKLREQFQERDLMIARLKSHGSDKNETKNSNKKLMEYSPVKYNGKLMNSIWGLYNRYSPHNIKAMEYESARQGSYVQQHSAVASSIASDIAMGKK